MGLYAVLDLFHIAMKDMASVLKKTSVYSLMWSFKAFNSHWHWLHKCYLGFKVKMFHSSSKEIFKFWVQLIRELNLYPLEEGVWLNCDWSWRSSYANKPQEHTSFPTIRPIQLLTTLKPGFLDYLSQLLSNHSRLRLNLSLWICSSLELRIDKFSWMTDKTSSPLNLHPDFFLWHLFFDWCVSFWLTTSTFYTLK